MWRCKEQNKVKSVKMRGITFLRWKFTFSSYYMSSILDLTCIRLNARESQCLLL